MKNRFQCFSMKSNVIKINEGELKKIISDTINEAFSESVDEINRVKQYGAPYENYEAPTGKKVKDCLLKGRNATWRDFAVALGELSAMVQNQPIIKQHIINLYKQAFGKAEAESNGGMLQKISNFTGRMAQRGQQNMTNNV